MYFEVLFFLVGFYEKLGYECFKEIIVYKVEMFGIVIDILVFFMVKMFKFVGGMSFYEWKEKGYFKFNVVILVFKK